MIMKKAVIYTRGMNQERQIEICMEYAKEKGYTVIAQKNEKDNLIGEPEMEVLLVATASRVTRKYEDFLFIEKMMNWYDVELVIVQK